MTKLPPLLTPQLLGKILDYARNQRRLIETDLEDAIGWERSECSDEKFYARLHRLVHDPNKRYLFNAIALKHSKNRSLHLPGAILRYYSRKKYPGVYSNHPDIVKERSTPKGRLGLFAKYNDPECFTNVGWTLLETELLDIDEVLEICAEFPEQSNVLREMVLEYSSESVGLELENALSDLSDVIDQMKPSVRDISLTKRLRDLAIRIFEIIELENEEFQGELNNLIIENEAFFEKEEACIPIRNQLTEEDIFQEFISDWRSQLTVVQQDITHYEKVDIEFNEITTQLSESNLKKQDVLLQTLRELSEEKKQRLKKLELNVSNLFNDSSDDEGEIGNEDISTDVDQPATTDEEQVNREEPTSTDVTIQTDRKEDLLPQIEGEANEEQEEIEDSICVEDTDQINNLDDHQIDDVSPTNNQEETEKFFESTATKLLGRLLKEGNYSLAYHVANASSTFDANVLGVLAEGAKVKPGSACSGDLAEFIDELATGKKWSKDENLLLVAAILQPLLFLKPYPDSLWQLASIVPSTPITEIVENFRNIYLPQGITLGPRSIQFESEETDFDERLHQISQQSKDFRDRIPHISFNYKPAERALHYLYQPNSNWYKLHRIVEKNQKRRAQEVSKLLPKLDPSSEINNIYKSISGCKPIEGLPKRKLVGYLHDSKKLADEWLELIGTANQEKSLRHQHQAELKQFAIDGLENIVKSMRSNQQNVSPAFHAARDRIVDLLSILKGGIFERKHINIDQACIRIPGIRLNEDMFPEETNTDSLIEVVKKFIDNDFDPTTLLDELVENDEFDRAFKLIELEDLDEKFKKKIDCRLEERRQELNKRFARLQIKIEEAFRLGQLWNSEEVINVESSWNISNRTDLLSLVSDGRQYLNSDASSLSTNILSTSKIVVEIEHRMNEITEKMISYLKSEQLIIEESFPDTLQGKDDKKFFSQKFDKYLEQQNFVTALDLRERAQDAVAKRHPIARTASTELSENLILFLKFTKRYWAKLKRFGLNKFKEAVSKKETIFSIQLSSIDDVRRDEALSVLSTWKDIKNSNDVKKVCRFIGFPVIDVIRKSRDQNINDLQHYEVELIPAGLISPLPVFGSALNSKLDIVVCNRSQEPEQVVEFIDQSHLSHGNAVLVLLTRFVSVNYRLKWLKECVNSKIMMLPLDTTLLMYLCGKRNRRSVLLDIGLPFTWAQPYITQGERVAKEMFVGRTNEVSDLIDPDGCCIVFGGRQLGKSALLTHVRRQHHNPQKEEGLFIEYLDVNDLGEPQSHEDMSNTFWKRVLKDLQISGAIDNNAQPRHKGAGLYGQITFHI